jgi:hypothetical protein
MKRKAKIRRSRDLPTTPGIGETVIEGAREPAAPGRSSIEAVDEHKPGSIESVPAPGTEHGIAGFIEPKRSDA